MFAAETGSGVVIGAGWAAWAREMASGVGASGAEGARVGSSATCSVPVGVMAEHVAPVVAPAMAPGGASGHNRHTR